ncbi:MAG: tetratricopeptide repeat protein [Gemmatimonadales bacterium]
MPGALPSSVVCLIPIAALAAITACSPRKSGTESASATTATATAGSTAEWNKGAVPLSTSSAEATDLYLQGRKLAEELRAHDGRLLFEQSAVKDPAFAMAHYQLAINSATAKGFFEHMNEAVALSDKASEGERLMILNLQAGGNAQPAKAREYAEELVSKYPNDERAHFLLGNAYFGQQDYDKSIEQFKKAIEINPQFSGAYNSLGYAYRPIEKYADAETAFRKYIELIPNDPNPYDSYAELLMKTGRFDESIAQYEKALSVDPHFSNAYIGVATNMMLQGKHDAAATQAQKLYDAARDDGDRRFALFARSVIFTDAGRTAAAIAEVQKEYDLDARLADTANMSGDALLIGNILLDAGKTDEAAKKFWQSSDLIEKSSLSAEVKADNQLAGHYNKARVALAKGDVATAKAESAAYSSGAEERHNNFRIRQAHELAGTIALKEKNYDTAITELGQANQQNPQVVYYTALAYRGKGDGVKAKEYATKAADANVLPLIAYAFVREKAKKMGA